MKNPLIKLSKVVDRYSKGIVLLTLCFGFSYIIAVTFLRYFTGLEPAESTDNIVRYLCTGELGAMGIIKSVQSISENVKKKKKTTTSSDDEDTFRG